MPGSLSHCRFARCLSPISSLAQLGFLVLFNAACAERGASSGTSAVQAEKPALSLPASSPSAGAAGGARAAAATPPSSANVQPESSAAASAAPSSSGPVAREAAPQAPAGAEAPTTPSLLDSNGKALPQTEERPRVDSASFQQRLSLLVEAIAKDDPKRALPAFFPVVAYEQVKAVEKPARDWQYRLIRAFEKDVHEYHKALGQDAASARFAGIDVPEPSARWMKPGSEGNRLGYFRVLRSRLRVAKADGKEKSFEVTSMISWRGEWYVVHLNGFD
jgi:hypothetical protein